MKGLGNFYIFFRVPQSPNMEFFIWLKNHYLIIRRETTGKPVMKTVLYFDRRNFIFKSRPTHKLRKKGGRQHYPKEVGSIKTINY